MARKRNVSTEISKDRVVNKLAVEYGDFAALCYTWMIPHAEDDCSITADPEELLYTVFPGRRDKTPDDVQRAIDAMTDFKLLSRVNGRLVFPPQVFYKYQSYIPENRRTSPNIAADQHELPLNGAKQRGSPQNTSSLSLSLSPSLSHSLSLSPSPDLSSHSSRSESDDGPYTEGFEEFWSYYPRTATGKKAAFRKWNATLQRKERGKKKPATEADLISAAKHYQISVQGKESNYIKLAQTFLGPDEHWRDYVDKPVLQKKPTAADRAKAWQPRSK